MSEEQTLCRFGVNYYINGMSVYEMSRRLPDHYLSSTEAEYYACSIGTFEGTFLVMTYDNHTCSGTDERHATVRHSRRLTART